MARIADLIDPPAGRLVLVYGPPGAGKSEFLLKLLAHNILDQGRPAIMVTSNREPEAVLEELRRIEPVFESRRDSVHLDLIDAYRGTVGLFASEQTFPTASCSDLSGLSITMGKVAKTINSPDLLIVFDRLTPIYLMNGANALKFVQTTLLRYAAEGRRVVVAIDEGCGRQEDITAMTSLAGAIIRVYSEGSQRKLDVIKYPGISPTTFAIASEETRQLRCRTQLTVGTENYQTHYAMLTENKIRPQLDDWIDLLWIQLVLWGGMAWDPIRFPKALYSLTKDLQMHCVKNSEALWTEEDRKYMRELVEKVNIHDPTSAANFFEGGNESMTSKRYFRMKLEPNSKENLLQCGKEESAICWGLTDVGSPLCFYDCGALAGSLTHLDKDGCEWEVYEQQCIGTGHERCTLVCSPNPTKEFQASFSGLTCQEADKLGRNTLNEILKRVEGGRSIAARPQLGDYAHLALFQEVTSVPALSDDHYLMAMRMAGARVGSQLATELSERGLNKDEATRMLEQIYLKMKAGRLEVAETVRMFENGETAGIKIGEQICFFTTGLLNGFFNQNMNRKVKKTKCIGQNDRYCEWQLY